jgi:MFS transporter, DHA1 family, inner membrane transport protein
MRLWLTQEMTSLALQITVASLCRVLLNTARRFPYPFAPALSRGMGVPLAAVTSLIAVNQVTGLLSLLFGPLADRWGSRIMLSAGLGFLATGMLGAGFFPFYGVILIGLFLAGLGKSAFDPALLAYVGERVPFQRRGLFVGFMETAWAASTLLGVPLIGFLMARLGWRAPFFAIGFLALWAWVRWHFCSAVTAAEQEAEPPLPCSAPGKNSCTKGAGLGILGFSFFLSIANDNFFVVYGAWMEQVFHLSVVALGATASVIGIAELLGEALTASLGDRLGLRRSMTVGLILSTGSYLLLPLLEGSLTGGLGALFSPKLHHLVVDHFPAQAVTVPVGVVQSACGHRVLQDLDP